MKARITLVVLLLLFILIGFTACDKLMVDTLAEDIPLLAENALLAQADIFSDNPYDEPENHTYEELYENQPEEENDYDAENSETEDESSFMYLPIPPMPIPPPPMPEPPRYKIALTFDDGPSQYTNYILDILEKYNARATFFVLGYRVQSREEIVLRAAELGNEIAGHSWSHPDFTALGADSIWRQITDTNTAIENVLGKPPPPFFRPPYGLVNRRVTDIAIELGYSIVNWSIDTRDWQNRDANIIYKIIMENAADGSIVLMHDIREPTRAAVERAVPSLIEQGFELVTVSELLEHHYGGIEPGEVYVGVRR